MYYFSRSSRFRLKSREEAAWCPLVLVRNIQGFSQGCHDEPARALFHGQGFNYRRRLHLASQVSTLYFCVQRMISMWQDSLLSWEAWHEHCTHAHTHTNPPHTPHPHTPSPLPSPDPGSDGCLAFSDTVINLQNLCAYCPTLKNPWAVEKKYIGYIRHIFKWYNCFPTHAYSSRVLINAYTHNRSLLVSAEYMHCHEILKWRYYRFFPGRGNWSYPSIVHSFNKILLNH